MGMKEKKTAGRLNPAPQGSHLVQVLSIVEAEIKNTDHVKCGDNYYRITYRIVRSKPDSSEIVVVPGTTFGLSIFKGKDEGKVNTDLSNLYAACKTADGDPTVDDQICVLKATREANPTTYKFSLEELLLSGYVPKAVVLLKRKDAKPQKEGKDPFPRHDWSAPSPETQAALEAAIARVNASPIAPAVTSTPPAAAGAKPAEETF